jgi:hypothetical protein
LSSLAVLYSRQEDQPVTDGQRTPLCCVLHRFDPRKDQALKEFDEAAHVELVGEEGEEEEGGADEDADLEVVGGDTEKNARCPYTGKPVSARGQREGGCLCVAGVGRLTEVACRHRLLVQSTLARPQRGGMHG